MSSAPEWVWGVLSVATALTGLVVILLSNPTHRLLSRMHRRRPRMALLLVFLICGSVGAVAWHLSTAKEDVAEAAALAARQETLAVEKAARHQLRNELADLIVRGRMLQTSVVNAGKGWLKQEQIGGLFSAVTNWHMEVLQFVAKRIGTADAMRIMAPTPSVQYPPGIQDPILTDGGKSGTPLAPMWDFLATDIAALEALLAQRPEL